MRAIRVRLHPLTVRVAAAAGAAVRSIPGAAGALLVAYGLGLAWRPLMFIAAGGFLLLADRRI